MTKTGSTTREERKLLEDAGKIIQRELSNGETVHIRGLGRFNVNLIEANMAGPGSGERKMAVIGVVRFRPFDSLKKSVRDFGGGGSCAVAKPEKNIAQRLHDNVDKEVKKAQKTQAAPPTEETLPAVVTPMSKVVVAPPAEEEKTEALPTSVTTTTPALDDQPAKKIDWL